ncbi:MAG TPA: VOC family protein [Acidimicrobiales bacterium]
MSHVDAATGTVRATVEVALPPAEAFRVFTAEIGSWYVVDRHTVVDHERTVDVRLEPHVGGRLLEVHDAATGAGRELARITAWEPPRMLAFSDARRTDTEVRFEPVAGGARTAVTIEQRGLDRLPPGEAEHVRRHGWPLLAGWFAASVQAREPEEARMTRTAEGRATLRGVTPYLYCRDAGAALDWLARTFGFEEIVRYVDADGVVHESEMRIGGSTIQVCGRAPGPDEGAGLLLIVHVDDVDAQHARVTAAGLDAPAPHQQPYGPRTFDVTDPWGYRWSFWQPVHDFVEVEGGLREIRAGG